MDGLDSIVPEKVRLGCKAGCGRDPADFLRNRADGRQHRRGDFKWRLDIFQENPSFHLGVI